MLLIVAEVDVVLIMMTKASTPIVKRDGLTINADSTAIISSRT